MASSLQSSCKSLEQILFYASLKKASSRSIPFLNACVACWRGTMSSSNQQISCPLMLTAPCLVLTSLIALPCSSVFLRLACSADARPVQNALEASCKPGLLSSVGLPRLLTLTSSGSQGTSAGDAALASPSLSRRTCHQGQSCDLTAAGPSYQVTQREYT